MVHLVPLHAQLIVPKKHRGPAENNTINNIIAASWRKYMCAQQQVERHVRSVPAAA
jgi:hypothetical protein